MSEPAWIEALRARGISDPPVELLDRIANYTDTLSELQTIGVLTRSERIDIEGRILDWAGS